MTVTGSIHQHDIGLHLAVCFGRCIFSRSLLKWRKFIRLFRRLDDGEHASQWSKLVNKANKWRAVCIDKHLVCKIPWRQLRRRRGFRKENWFFARSLAINNESVSPLRALLMFLPESAFIILKIVFCKYLCNSWSLHLEWESAEKKKRFPFLYTFSLILKASFSLMQLDFAFSSIIHLRFQSI